MSIYGGSDPEQFCWLLFVGLFPAFYSFILYPALLLIISILKRKEKIKIDNSLNYHSISILLPVYNESDFILIKLEEMKSLMIKNPEINYEVLIADDGSVDGTKELIEKWGQENQNLNYQFFNNENNKGKWSVLNQMIQNSKHEVLFICDISSSIKGDWFYSALRLFQNEEIVVVSPSYNLQDHIDHSLIEKFYWKFARNIRQLESNIKTTIGSHGAGYFIRKSAIPDLKQLEEKRFLTINDDFIIPALSILGNKENIYIKDAQMLEGEKIIRSKEFSRRLRIATGNLSMCLYLTKTLSFKTDFWAKFFLLSHKSIRVFIFPGFLFISLITFFYGHSNITKLASLSLMSLLYLYAPARANLMAFYRVFSDKKVVW